MRIIESPYDFLDIQYEPLKIYTARRTTTTTSSTTTQLPPCRCGKCDYICVDTGFGSDVCVPDRDGCRCKNRYRFDWRLLHWGCAEMCECITRKPCQISCGPWNVFRIIEWWCSTTTPLPFPHHCPFFCEPSEVFATGGPALCCGEQLDPPSTTSTTRIPERCCGKCFWKCTKNQSTGDYEWKFHFELCHPQCECDLDSPPTSLCDSEHEGIEVSTWCKDKNKSGTTTTNKPTPYAKGCCIWRCDGSQWVLDAVTNNESGSSQCCDTSTTPRLPCSSEHKGKTFITYCTSTTTPEPACLTPECCYVCESWRPGIKRWMQFTQHCKHFRVSDAEPATSDVVDDMYLCLYCADNVCACPGPILGTCSDDPSTTTLWPGQPSSAGTTRVPCIVTTPEIEAYDIIEGAFPSEESCKVYCRYGSWINYQAHCTGRYGDPRGVFTYRYWSCAKARHRETGEIVYLFCPSLDSPAGPCSIENLVIKMKPSVIPASGSVIIRYCQPACPIYYKFIAPAIGGHLVVKYLYCQTLVGWCNCTVQGPDPCDFGPKCYYFMDYISGVVDQGPCPRVGMPNTPPCDPSSGVVVSECVTTAAPCDCYP
jgi:hypothetical protein